MFRSLYIEADGSTFSPSELSDLTVQNFKLLEGQMDVGLIWDCYVQGTTNLTGSLGANLFASFGHFANVTGSGYTIPSISGNTMDPADDTLMLQVDTLSGYTVQSNVPWQFSFNVFPDSLISLKDSVGAPTTVFLPWVLLQKQS